VEPILQLKRKLARIGKVRPAEGVAVVEHVVIVADIKRTEAQIPILSE
jgi:hypothetical protein